MGDIRDYLRTNNIKFSEIKFNIKPKTVMDVVDIYGCQLSQVLKTLVFVGSNIVIVVLQGDRRVNIVKLELLCGNKRMRMATPEEIRDLFGMEIGSLSPFIKTPNCRKFIDRKIFNIQTVNMGSGIPEIGIEMATYELRKVWDGDIEDISA